MNKNILYLGLVSFFTDFATALINPILPTFIVVYLHQSPKELGIVIAVATFISYVLRIISGYISDRFGILKPLLVVGYTLSAIAKPLIGFAQDYKQVALFRAIERTGKALRSAPKDELIARSATNIGKGFGLHKTLDIAGEFSGTLTLFLILSIFGESPEIVRSVFLLSAIPGILALLFLLFVKDYKKSPKKLRLTFQDEKSARFLLWYLGYLIFFWNDAFFLLGAQQKGYTITTLPLFFLLSTATQTATSYYSGYLSDKIGEKKVLGVSFLFGIFALLSIYVTWWLSFIFLGLFTVFSLNAIRSYIGKEAHNKASLYGFFYASYAIMSAFGSLTVGELWHRFGFHTALFYATLGTIAITTLYFLKALRA